jgi:hypothetical protein
LRLVLCRPVDGLNDSLCQIEKAHRYARRFNRLCVVETNHKSSLNFRQGLHRFFVSRDDRLILDSRKFSPLFDKMTVAPSFLQGRVNSYDVITDESYVDTLSLQPIVFDESRDYEEELLVHHHLGHGDNSIFTLMKLRLHDCLGDLLAERLRTISGPYVAIHIRNTDYRTDFIPQLRALPLPDTAKIFIAADNGETARQAREFLHRHEVFSFSSFPDHMTLPLHRIHMESDQAFTRDHDVILDLFTLALAQRLFIFKLNAEWDGYSGFSRLAYNLWQHDYLLDQMIGRRDIALLSGRPLPLS